MLFEFSEPKQAAGQTITLSQRPIRILSLDGGGLRGIVAIKFLRWIENVTGKEIFDLFDVFAGTSTGGLIASALTLRNPNDPVRPRYSVDDLEGIYKNHGTHIFPRSGFLIKPYHEIRKFLRPRFSSGGLDSVLRKYFTDSRLTDCIKPVFITSYDVSRYRPIYFASRFVHRPSPGYISHENANATLYDICRATSAAPTYLPGHRFSYADINGEWQIDSIDGGVFLNNPSLAVYIEVVSNILDPVYNPEKNLKAEDICVLSIGTGRTAKSLRKSQNWGAIAWVKPIIEVMMQGNSQSVHEQMEKMLGIRYCRLDLEIGENCSDFVDSRLSTFNDLCTRFEAAFLKNRHAQNGFMDFRRYAQI